MSVGGRLGLDNPATYRVVVVGHVSRARLWFDVRCMDHGHDAGGTPITILEIQVSDQSMLHGLLARIRDLGLPLVSVCRTGTAKHTGGEE